MTCSFLFLTMQKNKTIFNYTNKFLENIKIDY